MRALVVLGKTLREVRRDLLVVALTLAFAPAFVLLYYVVFPQVSTSYQVVVVDEDAGASRPGGGHLDAGREIATALATVQGASENPLLRVRTLPSRREALDAVGRREAVAVVVIPDGFSQGVVAGAVEPVSFTVAGDLTHPGYVLAAALASATVQEYVEAETGRTGPVRMVEDAVGGSGRRSDFEIYVPGLIVFSVIMLIFLAAMTVAREIETGGMRRLRLTRMTAADYLLGTSGVILLVGIVAVLATFATAWACGFRSEGPLWVAIVVLTLTIGSVTGVGMVVAAVSRTVAQAFVIANFPLGLLMFFTGVMLPMPRVTWLTVAGHPLGPFELLAPTHAVTALNKVFTLGSGFGDVLFEVVALAVLSTAYFAAGVALLGRAHRRTA
ncbi:MAG: transporter permease [Actinomycetota bacterium]|nr:transporter permease [Actinomycetota bacterium]